jgi:hypothetical protein
MRFLLYVLALGVLLSGCSKEDEATKAETILKNQADIAKSKLQEKADALAREASATHSPAPKKSNTAKPPKP